MASNIHASCVCYRHCGILISGPSGSGKSDLALRLLARDEAEFVSDDRTDLIWQENKLMASAPQNIKGLLEVRGVGILKYPALDTVEVKLMVELVTSPQQIERLPEPEFWIFERQPIRKIKLFAFEASAPDKIIAALALI